MKHRPELPQHRSTHSPAPWLIDGQCIWNDPVTGSGTVARIIRTQLGEIHIIDLTNEPEANRPLISAAPELLDSLMQLEGAISQYIDLRRTWSTAVKPSGQLTGLIAMRDLARTRIAKAKGSNL